MTFHTYAKPQLNAAVFASIANDQEWNFIANRIELRLASFGLDIKHLQFKCKLDKRSFII